MTTSSADLSCGVFDLAETCGVDIGQACDRAGIARSTPSRWRSGTKPRPSRIVRLRQAILQLADEQGTLPASAAEEARSLGGAVLVVNHPSVVRAAIARIRRDLDLIERAADKP